MGLYDVSLDSTWFAEMMMTFGTTLGLAHDVLCLSS